MSDSELKQVPGWLRPTVEYGPLAAFLIAYYMADLFVATASIMVATVLALTVSYVVERRVPMMPLMTAVIVGVFGGLTLWLQDETFIKMKPTIIQAIFGAVLMVGVFTNRLFLKTLVGAAWHLTDEGWRVLTVRFSMFFFAMGALNEVVWRTQTTEFWVNFKVFGLMGLTFVFIMAQLPLIKRYSAGEDTTG